MFCRSIFLLAALFGHGFAADRPNILWITVEDMSPTLGCYGDGYATTPNLDAFAKQAVRYTHAFAVSPVCSPSRSCLITGVHPVTLGTLQMRSSLPLPTGVRGFPAYLREAGYFCTNNVKTDYNTGDAPSVIQESWDDSTDEAHWRDPVRKPDQPFFAVFNDMVTHQSRSMVWAYESFVKHVQSKLSPGDVHDPDKVPLPPYYPDTQVIRKTLARYYDCVSVMDQTTGRILAELESDGLAEDTIVFFFSDHGSGLPRHKRQLHDSGMRVAFMVRVPEKWQHLAPAPPGTVSRRMVSFLDLPPTVLNLAGISKPSYMQGQTILGKGSERERLHVYGSKDRIDEAFDASRSIRGRRYLYIRNYMPFLSAHQPSAYPDIAAIRREFTPGAEGSDLLTPAQYGYLAPTRVVEEFYDCGEDPHNVTNLVVTGLDQLQTEALARLRSLFAERQGEFRDLGALPESDMWRWMRAERKPIGDIAAGLTNHRPDLKAAWQAAAMVGSANTEALLLNLDADAVAIRHWAIIGLRQGAVSDTHTLAKVAERLQDTAPSVRIETAAWLAYHAPYKESALAVLANELDHDDWWVALRACRAIELLGERAIALRSAMREVYERTRPNTASDATLFLAFSAGAFLRGLGEPVQPWDFSPEAVGRKP